MPNASPMPNRFSTNLLVAFSALTLIFVSFTFVGMWFDQEIEERFASASSDALPSVAHLTAACDILRDFEAAADDYPDVSEAESAHAKERLDKLRAGVDAEIAAYRALPAYPGERELFESEVPASLRELDATFRHLVAEVTARELDEARVTADREVRRASNRAAGHLRAMVGFNARRAQDELQRIAVIHRASKRRALVLAGLATICSAFVAVWLLGRFRQHDRLLAAHNALVAARATELEVFGHRIAHDLLSPLSALTYCLGAFKNASEGDPVLEDALSRARRCVARAQTMVQSIFEFARAGGRADPSGRADLRDVVDQVVEDMRASEDERAAINVEAFEPCVVACPPGVLSSVLSNLLRNAAKYMQNSAVKVIAVRVIRDGVTARIEIEDTGPGVPPGLEARIFEPYVRAEGVTQPGLGLGLATVKRLCEAHGGAVGVRSKPGEGSVFWFTLPQAQPSAP